MLSRRYAHLLDEAHRSDFIAKLVKYVNEYGFAGIDVDLEGPLIDRNYGNFIQELSQALRAEGKFITAALSQGYGGEAVPDAALAALDFVNIMAYDATGPWEPDRAGPHSSMAFARSSVAGWLKRGLPKEKAVLGVPFYGYGFGQAFREDEYSYADLVAHFPGAAEEDRVGHTIWYNGRATIVAKANYVRREGLGGIMIWSLDSDVKGTGSLLDAIHACLRN